MHEKDIYVLFSWISSRIIIYPITSGLRAVARVFTLFPRHCYDDDDDVDIDDDDDDVEKKKSHVLPIVISRLI